MRIISKLFITLFVAGSALAQPMADRVPDDAILYLGWRGTNDLGPGYAGSHMEAIARESQFQKIFDDTLPAAVRALQMKNPRIAPGVETASAILTSTVRFPTVFFFAGITDGDQPYPKFGLLCRAGAGAPKLLSSIQKSMGQLPRDVPMRVRQSGDVVAVLFGYAPDDPVLAGADGTATPLAGSAAFKTSLARADSDAVIMLYVDVKSVTELVQSLIGKEVRDPNIVAKARTLTEELGLLGVNTLTLTGTFKDRNWQETMFIDAPARKGLLSLLTAKPFDAGLLGRVPASSTSMSAARLDLSKALTEIRRVATAVDPAWGDLVGKGIGAATVAVGKNFETDILEPLGDEWVMYNSPEIAGDGFLGMVAINKLDNPLKAKQGLGALSMFVSNTATTFTTPNGFRISVATMKMDDVTVYYVATPLVAPAWAIKDGYLYTGLYPQSVVAAMKYAGKGIGDNPKFAGVMSGLGQKNPIAIRYSDVAAQMPQGYPTAALVVRTGLGLLDMFAAQSPEMVLPPLGTLLRESAPAGSVMWADDAGIYMHTVQPFPGAETIAQASLMNMFAGQSLVLPSILLPSLNRARASADMIKSSSNLRQIGLATKMFANDNPGNKLPDDFEDILRTQDVSADIFVNPRTGNAVPPLPPGQTAAQALGEWVNTQSDYVYVGRGLTDNAPADRIIAYEKPAGLEQGINILYADGHVDFVTFPGVAAEFQRSRLPVPQW
ncbi:MAG: hypothetical protein H7144_02070 [Burkholderiales bacterium]|nr:hypothetical protein [Phycisphaerae bacterium]